MSSLFDVPRTERVSASLGDAFKDVRNGRRLLSWAHEFVEVRASGFPICPRAYHISRRLLPEHRLPKEEKYMTESTTLMGTALHLATQKWFGIAAGDKWYGNWKCPICGKIKRNKYGIQKCKRCKVEMIYEEYAIEKQKGIPFSGHIDGIIVDGGIVYLIDFKGAYADKIKYVKNSGRPVEKHFYQTNAYACAINKGKVDCGKITKIDKIIIIYIDRGRPHIFWYPVQVTPSMRVFKETKLLIKMGKKSIKSLTVPSGLCTSPRDPNGQWCQWSSLCFNPKLTSLLNHRAYSDEELFQPNVSSMIADRLIQQAHLQNQM